MSKFFINRPIVAMVIAIVTVIVGAVTIAGLPVAQFPAIAPPEIQVLATYVGADAQTVHRDVVPGVDDDCDPRLGRRREDTAQKSGPTHTSGEHDDVHENHGAA